MGAARTGSGTLGTGTTRGEALRAFLGCLRPLQSTAERIAFASSSEEGRRHGPRERNMTRFAPMPNRSVSGSTIEDRIFERLQRRAWPIAVSIVFLIVGLLYFFRWASVVSHSPAQWWSAGDLSDSFRATTTLVQGNFGAYSQWVC